jgi:hypothetical protein
VVPLLAIAAAWLPRVAIPLAAPIGAVGCTCPERGSPVIFDEATVAREPTIFVEGDACDAKSVECMHRDAKDRCDTFWIVPTNEGQCVFSARFPDGTSIESVIDYNLDGEWPCRGNVRPTHEHVARVNSKT